MHNRSPWITHLGRTRTIHTITSDHISDVAIVGAGIAGVATAYFILKHTPLEVILIDGGKVAHGATGHNAGQLVTYFERSFTEIVNEFGITQAAAGVRAIESAWGLLDEIVREYRMTTPLYRFTGYAGIASEARVLQYLHDNAWRKKAGLPLEHMTIASDAPIASRIPKHFQGIYSLASQSEILSHLQTADPQYVAMLTNKRGVMNSARFTEELVGCLLATYPERLTLSEETPVQTVVLSKQGTRLLTSRGIVNATKTVLCTNGFEYLTIKNTDGPAIDTAFHHDVNGVIGYMAGYALPDQAPPSAISYILGAHGDNASGEPYFYVTRRPHEGNPSADLLCVGGPDYDLPDRAHYEKDGDYFKTAEQEIDGFVRATYDDTGLHGRAPEFRWQGLMGYTPNRIRRIGVEPKNNHLLYNLGCNGIGLLPAIYGGKRISQIVNGEHLEPSIFDPKG